MAHWVNKSIWRGHNGTTPRSVGKTQSGVQGDKVHPTAYSAYHGNFPVDVRLPNGSYAPKVDTPNLTPFPNVVSAGASYFPAARNKAWSALVEDIRKGPASLGQAFAEMPQALQMVGDRALTMYRSYRNLRRGDFRGALKALRIEPKRKHRNKLRNGVGEASSLWLEYSFGWKPLCKDMYDGVHALGEPLPGGKCSGSGRESARRTGRSGVNEYQLFGAGYVKQGAIITVVNPNTYALQQLGLANPLQIAWELVPFSFLVDWVFDVGTALGGLTDLFGCDVQSPYTTTCVKLKGKIIVHWDYSPKKTWTVPGQGSSMKRVLGLSKPAPNMRYHANIGTSMNRAANAVSLLGQILSK